MPGEVVEAAWHSLSTISPTDSKNLSLDNLSIEPAEQRRHANRDHARREGLASEVARTVGREVGSANPAYLAEGTAIPKFAHGLVIGLHKPLALLAPSILRRYVRIAQTLTVSIQSSAILNQALDPNTGEIDWDSPGMGNNPQGPCGGLLFFKKEMHLDAV